MKLYKGFDKNLRCKGFQYEIGKTYETDKAELCKKGFHACENPLDVFYYYSPSDSRYCEVELDDITAERGDDTKRVGRRIKIGAEIGVEGIVDAAIKIALNASTCQSSETTNTGDGLVATNMGDYSMAINIGYCSVATNRGYRSVATNTSDGSVAMNMGDYSMATNTGYHSVATNMGDYSAATNTGPRSMAMNAGDYSAVINTGDYSAAMNAGTEGVAIALGKDGKAKGAMGCWLVVAEWQGGHRINVVSAMVDGKIIKTDTFYTVKGGKLVEWE